mmetsp:Transcript_23981/g.44577  ORF Transcript_23981/g.44577 Transcript_23981/m.44577 type:complete len:294 (+) Transcript_23981:146-1027(+)
MQATDTSSSSATVKTSRARSIGERASSWTTTKKEGMNESSSMLMIWKSNERKSPPLSATSSSASSCQQQVGSPMLSSISHHVRIGKQFSPSLSNILGEPCTSTTVSPSVYLAVSLQNHNIKQRVGAFSMLQAIYFEPYTESEIPVDLLQVLRENNLERLQSACEGAMQGLDEARNEFGENLAHLVCRLGLSTEVLKWLVNEKRVPLNVRDRFGRSPLHHAVSAAIPNFENIEFLLEHATQLVLFEDEQGKTPFECIPRRSFDRWSRFLSEHSVLKRISFELGKHEALQVATSG